jgi:hypothetical protein
MDKSTRRAQHDVPLVGSSRRARRLFELVMAIQPGFPHRNSSIQIITSERFTRWLAHAPANHWEKWKN